MDKMGQRIREERIRNKMTQEELADRLGVSRQTISAWEKGKAKYIDRIKANQMAEIFNCEPSWLMDMADAKNVMVTYQADGKQPVTMRISDEHDLPIIGTTALKVKLYKTVSKVPPELYETAIDMLESLIKS